VNIASSGTRYFESDLEKVFREMQGEIWSPNGEAYDLIDALGVEHTSMSTNDIVVGPDNVAWIVDRNGFSKLVK
jgi:hypothetical protein